MAVPSLVPAPEEFPSRPAEPIEGADHYEVAHCTGANGAAAEAVDEIVEGGVGAGVGAFVDDRLAAVVAEVAHVVEADTHPVCVLNNLGWRGFEISIPWPEVGRLGEEPDKREGPAGVCPFLAAAPSA